MSEPIDLTVRTEADYERNAAMAAATRERILEQARKESWPSEREDEALIDALLPYYRANTDPASPAASQALLNEYLMEQGDDALVLNAKEHATLYTSLAQQTRLLNAVHGVNYAPPAIVIVDRLLDDKETPMQFNNDAILIDKAYFEAHGNDSNFSAGIAHELSHRYQRSDNELRLYLKINELKLAASDTDLANAHSIEIEADFDARRVTAPGAFKSFLRQAMADKALVLGHYMATNPSLTTENALIAYEALDSSRQQQLKLEASAQPAATQDAYFKRGIQATDASNNYLFNPKLQDRFALQDALDRYPAVLTCRNIQFDGDTHIVQATECGPKNVPLVVDGVPTGNRVRP